MSPAVEGLAARRVALEALCAVEERGAWSNRAVPDAVAGLADERDRAFASHLAYDTLRWQGTLDWALGQAVTRPLDEVEPALRRLLRLGALQLLRTEIPGHAVVNTAAALARELVPRSRSAGAVGFVNGVLRALARQRDLLERLELHADPVERLTLTTAHPEWVVKDLIGRYGAERARSILHADNDPPGLTLRAVGDRDALVAELRDAGVDARPGLQPEAVRAPGADPRRLPAVRHGRAVPQDEASMWVARATGAAPGDLVLDLCAGPGGKSTHLASLVGPGGRVVAVELRPGRARMIADAAARQHVAVQVLVGDAADPPLRSDAGFDVVLLDAPCTGLGTGRRRPEIRWRRRSSDAQELAALQRRLLAAAVDRVAVGGMLTYSVCTWTAVETDEVADHLEQLRGAELEPLERRQLLPDREGTDGMYVARWRRRVSEARR